MRGKSFSSQSGKREVTSDCAFPFVTEDAFVKFHKHQRLLYILRS